MATRIRAETERPRELSTYDQTCMEILERLDALKGLALKTGDQELVDGLGYVFEAFITRYCDSKHAELNTQLRRHFLPPKTYMN
ncbi:MAG: hypothetical protein QM647_00135 [Asticcacaulis sp.]|uniref:hypothetical protein n=1 Tax=Asticcacaulis sp. TaxID=1872648 RepID=UPI0039E52DD2